MLKKILKKFGVNDLFTKPIDICYKEYSLIGYEEEINADFNSDNIFIELQAWGADSYLDAKNDYWIHTSFTHNLYLHHDGKVYRKEYLLTTYNYNGYLIKENGETLPKDTSETKKEYLGFLSKENLIKLKGYILTEEKFFERKYVEPMIFDADYTITINISDKSKRVLNEMNLYSLLEDNIIKNLPKNNKSEVIEHLINEISSSKKDTIEEKYLDDYNVPTFIRNRIQD